MFSGVEDTTKILQSIVSVALLISPENVLQPEGNKEEKDENTEKKLRVKEGGRL